ncbi:MAG: hypothetical protein IKO41_17855 [Lachnospiraceae bacterium]|nr:hypothetical protein [Lachnospiraceae bacterium]
MTYGAYNFIPAGKLDMSKIREIADLLLRSHTSLRMWDGHFARAYDEVPSCSYSHAEFYEAMNDAPDDLFMCEETGKLYVPCEHELMEFLGYRRDGRAAV